MEPYITNGGGEILLLETGAVSHEKMFKSALESNSSFTWVIRITGLIMMTIGLILILKPLSIIAEVLPILGDIVGAGAGLIALIVAIVLTVITIAVAWLVFRPLIGVGLLLIAGLMVWVIRGKLKANKSTTNSEATTT